METTISRRGWLGSAAALLAATGLKAGAASGAATAATPRKRVLRLAHLTDMHLQPGPAEGGFVQALHHLQGLADPAQLVLTGGDTVMDSFGHDRTSVERMWNVWRTLTKAELSLPMRNCLGNHDCWGGNKAAAKVTGDEPQYGKKWACDIFGLERTYYSFDQAGWHFVVLDGTFVVGNSYVAKLDDEQMAWLKADLAAVPKATPVLVLSHQPILSVCAMLADGKLDETKSNWQIGGGTMSLQAKELKDLFAQQGNVKVALSGHIHLIDEVAYNGTTYWCNGAVSGNWWNVKHPARMEAEPGYAVIDLYDDGTAERSFQIYGWKPDVGK